MKLKIYNENTNQKKGVISQKFDFRPKKITRNKKQYYIIIKVSEL